MLGKVHADPSADADVTDAQSIHSTPAKHSTELRRSTRHRRSPADGTENAGYSFPLNKKTSRRSLKYTPSDLETLKEEAVDNEQQTKNENESINRQTKVNS